jgi:hypothetical protein
VHVVERREQLSVGEVAGPAENHERRWLRRGVVIHHERRVVFRCLAEHVVPH